MQQNAICKNDMRGGMACATRHERMHGHALESRESTHTHTHTHTHAPNTNKHTHTHQQTNKQTNNQTDTKEKHTNATTDRKTQPQPGSWCSGITPAQHAGGPGFNPQCVHNHNTPRPRQQRPPPPNLQPTPTNSNASYSSVGRASGCRRLQQSDGPWFDSGWPDICTAHTSPDTNQANGCTNIWHTRI